MCGVSKVRACAMRILAASLDSRAMMAAGWGALFGGL